MKVPPRPPNPQLALPRPSAAYRRRGWLELQLALDPLAEPHELRPVAERRP